MQSFICEASVCLASSTAVNSARFCSHGEVTELLFQPSKAVRAVLRWQSIATVVLASIAWPWSGWHGAGSALLGGLINLIAVLAYFTIVGLGAGNATAGAAGTIRRLVRAEASKIMIIVGAVWLALAYYKGLVVVPFFGAFIVTVLVPGVALLITDDSIDSSVRSH